MYNKVKEMLNVEQSFDIKERTIIHQDATIRFLFLDFLSSSKAINEIIFSIINYDFDHISSLTLLNRLMIGDAKKVESINDIALSILKGEMAIFIIATSECIIVDTKSYPSRGLEEPDSEKVVRGSRDGFTENLSTNVALIRRRISNNNLIFEKYVIGKSSNTLVSLVYLKDVIDKDVLSDIRRRLENVKTIELTMSDKALEEHLTNNSKTLFPLVKYTERPDTFSSQLYQGMFGIIVDTSPSAILGPISIFDHLEHAEEFRQTRISGSYLRIIRFLGIIAGFLIMPVFYALARSNYIPKYIGYDNNKLFLQIFIISLSIEVIRMASIHTPSALSTSMGIISGMIIGNMAVDLRIIPLDIAFIASLSALSSYITPSYELSLANKMVNLFFIIAIYLFKMPGLIISMLIFILYLISLKSFNQSYLYPLIPFDFTALKNHIFRKSYIKKKKS